MTSLRGSRSNTNGRWMGITRFILWVGMRKMRAASQGIRKVNMTCRKRGIGCGGRKFEARNPKLETSPKLEIRIAHSGIFRTLKFEFASSFELRISDFE